MKTIILQTMINILLAFLISFSFIGCEKDPLILKQGEFGKDFTLKIGQSIILKDSKMEIDSLIVKFEDFISEGRCPENTICIWQGEAIIEISLKNNLAVELSTAYNYNVPLDTLGYKIRLYDLKPYPKRWNQEYKKSKYEATLNISK